MPLILLINDEPAVRAALEARLGRLGFASHVGSHDCRGPGSARTAVRVGATVASLTPFRPEEARAALGACFGVPERRGLEPSASVRALSRPRGER